MPFLILLIAILCLTAFVLWWAKWRTYHFAVVQPGVLYRCGNRGVGELATAVRRANIKTIVTLIDDQELADTRKPQFAEEAKWCQEHDVRLERIAVPLGGWPTSDNVRQFLTLVSDKQNQPVMVHCAQGVRRTGMMVAAYERSVLGWDPAKCRDSMLTFGHSQRTVGDVQRFIDVYDPKTGAVPEGLPKGDE